MTYSPRHLGKTTTYPTVFDASLLEAIPRELGRASLGLQRQGIDEALPFIGCDVWQAYEVSWLSQTGQSVVSVLSLKVPVTSFAIVESKSFKLYLQSFHMTRFTDVSQVRQQVSDDISALLQINVQVELQSGTSEIKPLWQIQPWQQMQLFNQGVLHLIDLDTLIFDCQKYQPDARLLSKAQQEVSNGLIAPTVYVTQCFRSLCPATGQPDFASILVMVAGLSLEPAALGQYLHSYRLHQGFHEQCIESIFLDIAALDTGLSKGEPQLSQLSVVGRFTRRGGIDINPERHLNGASEVWLDCFQQRQYRQ